MRRTSTMRTSFFAAALCPLSARNFARYREKLKRPWLSRGKYAPELPRSSLCAGDVVNEGGSGDGRMARTRRRLQGQ
jgi:hypothetical protein